MNDANGSQDEDYYNFVPVALVEDDDPIEEEENMPSPNVAVHLEYGQNSPAWKTAMDDIKSRKPCKLFSRVNDSGCAEAYPIKSKSRNSYGFRDLESSTAVFHSAEFWPYS